MTKSQKADWAYHEDRLLLLIARLDDLPANSNQMPDLANQISAVGDLVRSYRFLKAMGG